MSFLVLEAMMAYITPILLFLLAAILTGIALWQRNKWSIVLAVIAGVAIVWGIDLRIDFNNKAKEGTIRQGECEETKRIEVIKTFKNRAYWSYDRICIKHYPDQVFSKGEWHNVVPKGKNHG